MHPSRLGEPEYQPFATSWTHKRKAAVAQEGQRNQALEGEAKPHSAVRQEIIRVEKGCLKAVDDLELIHSPRTLGIDDKLLSKTTCVERNAVPS